MHMETWGWKDTAVVAWCAVLGAAAILAIFPGWPAVADALESDAAPAWAQAIGSVGAILVAVWVSQWQVRKAARSNAVTAILMTRSFAGLLFGAAEQVIALARANNYQQVQVLHAMVEEVMHTGRLIHAEQLSLEWVGAIHMLRSIGAQMTAYLRATGPQDLQGMWAEKTVKLFTEHRNNIEHIAETIVKHQHPGIPAPAR